MIFEDWMRYRGLAPSSAKKYLDAIKGPLSKWAIDHAFVAGPLTSLISPLAFQDVNAKIRQLAEFRAQDQRGHGMYGAALKKFEEYLSDGYSHDVGSDLDAILEDPDIRETEKSDLVKSRIGQGTFRQRLLSCWDACAITGFADTNLLVASHIKPWCVSNNAERLDPFNGLLLVPNLDKVFDLGLVTFEQRGPIKISPLLTAPDRLGITPAMRVSLSGRHAPYMDFHRSEVFRAG